MILQAVVVGRTRITLEQGLVDGLYVVVKGRTVQWVSDNIESAQEYFNQLIQAA